MNIAEYSIRNSVVTSVVTIALLVVGYMSFQQLSRLEDPKTGQVRCITQGHENF